LPIVVLQHPPDLTHVLVDVAEQRHDSGDVAVIDRPFDAAIVAAHTPARQVSLPDILDRDLRVV
jgi:hypothetical protein